MKSKLILVFALSLASFAVTAQSLKIGYADVEYIFSKMPESKQIESQLQAHQAQLEAQMKAKIDEYQTKLQALQSMDPNTTSELVQQERINELTQLEQSIQTFQTKAQENIVSKREELLAPVYTKVGNSIKAVAEENSFDFILTAGVGGTDIVLFAADKYDVSDLVLKNMGVSTDG